MHSILKSIIILIFLSYWASTVFFTLPDNQLNLTYYEESRLFQLVFFQKWGFFAPPPKENHGAYLTFLSHSGEQRIFEIIEPIVKRKQREAPFNWEANTIDYIINNSIGQIRDLMVEAQEIYKYELSQNNQEQDIEKLRKEMVQKAPAFQMLLNYSEMVAKKNQIDPNEHDLVVLITAKPIPKFHKRFELPAPSEEVLFVSDTLKYVGANQTLSFHQD